MGSKKSAKWITSTVTKIVHQTKKTLPTLSFKDQTEKYVKPVLNTLVRYESGHESPSLSTIDEKGFSANFISIYSASQDPKNQ